jgi:hypothetical protein
MQWIKYKEQKPSVGQRVLIWHPRYEHLIAYTSQYGFYEAVMGEIKPLDNIEWWMPLPEQPKE